MSLNWNIKEIQAHKGEAFCWPEVNGEKRLNGTIECMIWATMFVGLPVLDDKSAEDFFQRLWAWEKLHGPIRSNGKPLTASDVQDCIGLRTNASTMTKAQWRKKLDDMSREKATQNAPGSNA